MALAENWANNESTTINQGGGIASGDTSVTVASATGWPTSGQYRALVDSELVLIVGGQGTTTWTIVRGIEGTTPANHSDGATITQILTRGGLIGVAGSTVLSDSYSLIPSSSVVGRLFLPKDGSHLLRDNGTSWLAFGPVFPMTVPDNSQFSWVNQGSASVKQSGSAVYLSALATGSRSVRARVQSAPTAPYTVTTFIKCNLGPDDGNEYGLGWRESSSGKMTTFAMAWANGALNWQSINWNSATSLNSTNTVSPNGNIQISTMGGFWFRIQDDNTNFLMSYSFDGENFLQVGSVARTSFITADQILFFADPNSATRDIYMTVYDWTVTQP